MPLKIGTSAVSLKLGSQAVVGYLGSQIVTANVPGAPAIDGASATNGSTNVLLFAAPADGGSPITSYEFTFDDVPVVPDTVSDLEFTFNASYSGQDVRVRAVNAVGPGPYSETGLVG